MLVITKRAETSSRVDVEISLPFDVRKKCRFKTVSTDGEEVGIFLDRGTVIANDDRFLSEDVSIEIDNDCLRIAYDEVLKGMVEGLGAFTCPIHAPFHPEKGAYAGGHSHGPEHGKGRGPIIHDLSKLSD